MDTKTNIWERMQEIDPRYLYAALIVFIVVPLLFGTTIPGIPSDAARQGYQTVETIAKEKPDTPVLISADWSASTRGESHWQSIAILRQIMRDHLKFALISFDARNPSLEKADIATVSDELVKNHTLAHPYVYGVDYCFWGYKPSGATPQILKGIVNDVPGTIKVDYRGTPFSQLPCMNGIHTVDDFSIIFLEASTSSLDSWLQFVVKNGNPPLIYFPTSVMAPEGYPYLQSHQIAGMVTGVKGAGDYEQLEHVNGFGRKISTALSLVYFLILLLIVIGNVGYYGLKQSQRRQN